jgi:deoxyribonuclease V
MIRAGMARVGWPSSAEELEVLQRELADLEPPAWTPDPTRRIVVVGVFAASATGLVGTGAAGDALWAAAVAMVAGDQDPLETAVVRGRAGGPYVPGFLAMREGELLERVVASLGARADVALVNGTGRDHPRRAGIALHLGAVIDVPTVGVTDRPLLAAAEGPPPERGAAAPLRLDGELVGYAVRTRRGARPVVAHAAWRTDADVARALVLLVAGRARTPDPIRHARRLVRETRAHDEGPAPHGRRRAGS